MTDILTTKIYKYATVFLDNFSRYSYMYLQQTASSEETIEGKHAFESMIASHGIIIEQYHAYNGIFRANSWVQHCQEHANQHLTTYTRVDDHHTNGLAERRIRDIQDNVRAMILRAQHKWLEAITAG